MQEAVASRPRSGQTGARGRPTSPSGGCRGLGGAEQDPGPRWGGQPCAAEQDMGWSRAWLAGESRERWGTLMQQVDECWYVGVTPGREDVRLVEEEGAWVVCPAGPEAVQVCPCAG